MREYCAILAQETATLLLGSNLSYGEEYESILADLEEELRRKYKEEGQPNGPDDSGILEYFLNTTVYIIEENEDSYYYGQSTDADCRLDQKDTNAS